MTKNPPKMRFHEIVSFPIHTSFAPLMERRRCRHCSKGEIILDAAAGIYACSACGRIDETVTHFVEETSFLGSGHVRLLTEQRRPTILNKRGVLREKSWFETIDVTGHSLRLPFRVISEAKSLFLETSNVHQKRIFGRKLLSGVLLFAACRRFGIPLTMPEMATVVGVRSSTFNRHYK